MPQPKLSGRLRSQFRGISQTSMAEALRIKRCRAIATTSRSARSSTKASNSLGVTR